VAIGRSLVAVALAVSVACSGDGGTGSRDTIALLAGNALAGSDRVARLLDEIAAVTDILGPARFEIVDGRGAELGDLGDLADRRDLRAVIALVGDLSVLQNVDPTLGARRLRVLSSRRVDTEALEEALDRLATRVDGLGARLVLATHPLGTQGSVEVPELAAVAELLRGRGAVLDLAAHFAPLESSALFENRIDRLNAFGHDELARAILRWLVEEGGPALPPRTEDEALARAQTRALWTWLRGPQGEFEEQARRALRETPRSPRARVRAAALDAALDPAGRRWCAGWQAVPRPGDDDRDAPSGRALALRLCGETRTADVETSDPLERGLLHLLDAIEDRDGSAFERARELCDAFPHRLEAWIGLDLAARWTRSRQPVWSEARATLGAISGGPIPARRALVLRGGWPESVAVLPSLLVASRPFASFLPDGPALALARRRAALGFPGSAARIIGRALERGRRPALWAAERDRLRAARR